MTGRHLYLLAFAAIAAISFSSGARAQSSEPLRIPYAHVFSGPAADFGNRIWDEGGVLGAEQVNAAGGIKGRKLEFVKIDVRFPETTPFVADFRRLAADPNNVIVFGVGATKTHLAIFDLIEEAKIPALNPSSAGVWPLPNFGNYSFRYQPQNDQVMPILIAKVKERFKPNTAAVVFGNDDEALVNNAKVNIALLEKAGIKVIEQQTYRNKETNFAAQISAIRNAKPDIIVLSMQPYDGGTFTLQLRERGLTQQIIGDLPMSADDFHKNSKGKSEGAICFTLYSPHDDRPIVQNWVKLWREKTGKRDEFPDTFATAYYDATQLLAHVLRTAPDLSREAIRNTLASLKDFEVVSGKISYAGAGDAIRREPVLVQWQDGKLVPWK